MNKNLVTILLALSLTMGLTGCETKPAQIKVIADNVGYVSAVSWIAADNPDQKEMKAVLSVLDVINAKAEDVKAGSLYRDIILPDLRIAINKEVEAQYRPLALAGGGTLLGAIDMLFATKPEWKENHDLAVDVVAAFVSGAKKGLALAEDSPVIIQARGTAAARARAWKE